MEVDRRHDEQLLALQQAGWVEWFAAFPPQKTNQMDTQEWWFGKGDSNFEIMAIVSIYVEFLVV